MEQRIRILDQVMAKFMQYGIRAVSMDDISSDLGISKKTLYQSFDSKSELVDGALTRYSELEEELLREYTKSSRDAVDEMIHVGRHTVSHMRQIKPVLVHDLQKYYKATWQSVRELHMSFFKGVIEENINRGIKEGWYREDLDSDIIAKLYVSKSFSLVDEGLFSLQLYQREHLLQQHVIYHLYGILSLEGIKHFKTFQLFKD